MKKKFLAVLLSISLAITCCNSASFAAVKEGKLRKQTEKEIEIDKITKEKNYSKGFIVKLMSKKLARKDLIDITYLDAENNTTSIRLKAFETDRLEELPNNIRFVFLGSEYNELKNKIYYFEQYLKEKPQEETTETLKELEEIVAVVEETEQPPIAKKEEYAEVEIKKKVEDEDEEIGDYIIDSKDIELDEDVVAVEETSEETEKANDVDEEVGEYIVDENDLLLMAKKDVNVDEDFIIEIECEQVISPEEEQILIDMENGDYEVEIECDNFFDVTSDEECERIKEISNKILKEWRIEYNLKKNEELAAKRLKAFKEQEELERVYAIVKRESDIELEQRKWLKIKHKDKQEAELKRLANLLNKSIGLSDIEEPFIVAAMNKTNVGSELKKLSEEVSNIREPQKVEQSSKIDIGLLLKCKMSSVIDAYKKFTESCKVKIPEDKKPKEPMLEVFKHNLGNYRCADMSDLEDVYKGAGWKFVDNNWKYRPENSKKFLQGGFAFIRDDKDDNYYMYLFREEDCAMESNMLLPLTDGKVIEVCPDGKCKILNEDYIRLGED